MLRAHAGHYQGAQPAEPDRFPTRAMPPPAFLRRRHTNRRPARVAPENQLRSTRILLLVIKTNQTHVIHPVRRTSYEKPEPRTVAARLRSQINCSSGLLMPGPFRLILLAFRWSENHAANIAVNRECGVRLFFFVILVRSIDYAADIALGANDGLDFVPVATRQSGACPG